MNGTNSSVLEPEWPPVHVWLMQVLPVLYILIFTIGVLANSMVIFIAVLKIKESRSTTFMYILNLSLADMLVIVPLPMWAMYVRDRYIWRLHPSGCYAGSFVMCSSVFISVLTVTWISLDRCMAVMIPFRTVHLRTTRVAVFVISVIWVVALLLGVITNIGVGTSNHDNLMLCGYTVSKRFFLVWNMGNEPLNGLLFNMVGFIVPFVVVFTCYTLMFYTISQLHGSEQNKFRTDKVLRILLCLIGIFFTIWSPYTLFNLYSNNVPTQTYSDLVNFNTIGELLMALGMLNSCVNPVLYCLWTMIPWDEVRRCFGQRVAPQKSKGTE
uniref:type-1 angiotensin II receptor A-like n=1 Tax=Myxine glutinosa TaxID=7769 RepID=UPI00358ED346